MLLEHGAESEEIGLWDMTLESTSCPLSLPFMFWLPGAGQPYLSHSIAAMIFCLTSGQSSGSSQADWRL